MGGHLDRVKTGDRATRTDKKGNKQGRQAIGHKKQQGGKKGDSGRQAARRRQNQEVDTGSKKKVYRYGPRYRRYLLYHNIFHIIMFKKQHGNTMRTAGSSTKQDSPHSDGPKNLGVTCCSSKVSHGIHGTSSVPKSVPQNQPEKLGCNGLRSPVPKAKRSSLFQEDCQRRIADMAGKIPPLRWYGRGSSIWNS